MNYDGTQKRYRYYLQDYRFYNIVKRIVYSYDIFSDNFILETVVKEGLLKCHVSSIS